MRSVSVVLSNLDPCASHVSVRIAKVKLRLMKHWTNDLIFGLIERAFVFIMFSSILSSKNSAFSLSFPTDRHACC